MTVAMQNAPADARASVRTRPRRIVLFAMAVALTVVLLEVVLQIGAYLVWRGQHRPPPTIEAGHDVVLCVGDSWTYGMGSSDPAQRGYPARLQGLLEANTGRKWTVVNGGKSGQNSRDVLETLASQIAAFRPRIVCVLVGMNDYWSSPAELPPEATTEYESYRFRWRIPRLATWIAGRFGGNEMRASARDSLNGPEWAPRTPVTADPYAQEPTKWRTTDRARASIRAGNQARAAKQEQAALAAFELAFAECPDDAQVRGELAPLVRNSDRSRADTHLDWLRQSWQRDHDYRTGRCLVFALGGCNLHEDIVAFTREFLDAFPEDAGVWWQRGASQFQLGAHADALESLMKSIRLAPTTWAYHDLAKVYVLGLRDYDQTLRTLFTEYTVFNDSSWLRNRLRSYARLFRDRLRPVLATFECEPATHARIERVLDEVLASDDDTIVAVLSAHLRRVVAMVQGSGATTVLLNYPHHVPAADVLAEQAAASGVRFVDVETRFRALLDGRSWESVAAPDGHCNDDGYRLMAQAIAEGLTDLVR